MQGELLVHNNNKDEARVLTEPFPHLIGGMEEAPDQVVLVVYENGASAGSIDIVPVDHLCLYWQILPEANGNVKPYDLDR